MKKFSTNKLLWIVLFIVIGILIYNLYEKCNQVDLFTYEGRENGPKILVVGGTHGNEPSGYEALKNLKEKLDIGEIKIKRGKLVMIPEVNKCGIKAGLRWNPGNLFNLDINRAYPTSIWEDGKCYITQKIKEAVDNCDFILDLHEGYNFYHLNPKSIGSTISPGPTPFSEKISEEMKIEVNKGISERYKKFHIIKYDKKDVIPGTLSEYCRVKNKDYILIETTGQSDIQPLDIRVKQMKTVINVLLREIM